MRVALVGAGSLAVRWVAPALAAAGHDVVPMGQPAGRSGRQPSELEGLTAELSSCHALVNLGTEAVRGLVEAARTAGVRRIVQHSVSLMYADQGQDWITERSPLCVTTLTEAASLAEMVVQDYASPCRDGVVLRMGQVFGDATMRLGLRGLVGARCSGQGGRLAAEAYLHVVHCEDVGPAVNAALGAPSGIYNVGAAPVRRAELVDACARAGVRPRAGVPGPARLWSRQLEPMTRSLRVSSSAFMGTTGWAPRRERFDTSWFGGAGLAHVAVR